jgi:phosphoglycolate phosphatase
VGDLRRLIVFDLDGTLVDSRRDLADSANALIVELGGAPLTEEAIGRMVGEGAATLVRRALAAAGLRDVRSALARFLEIYDTRLLNHTRLYAGIEDTVRRASALGRVAVLTNKPRRPSELILRGLGLFELVDEVIGGDGPLPRKPDPAALLKLMADAGVTPEATLMVGDSPIDHETARRAGTRCCLVAFGFGFESFPADRLAGDESIARDAAELRRLLDAFAEETAEVAEGTGSHGATE